MKEKAEMLKLFFDEDEDGDFDSYVETIDEEFEWAGYFELYCMSLMLGINFVIVLKDLNIIRINHNNEKEVRTLFLGFHEDEENGILEHYTSLRVINDVGKSTYSL